MPPFIRTHRATTKEHPAGSAHAPPDGVRTPSIGGWRRLLCTVTAATLSAAGFACGDPAPADDDSAGTPGPDPTPAEPCDGAHDPSGGSGAPEGRSWLPVAGWTTDTDAVPDREVLLHVPAGIDPTVGAPLMVLMTRPIPQDRAAIEQIAFDYLGQDAFADSEGWIFAMPMPGPFEAGQLGWYSQLDSERGFLGAAIDAIEAALPVDRQRIHLYGTSAGGRYAVAFGHAATTRIASVIDHAGSNPFSQWPALPWPRALPALLIHDEADPIVSRAAMEDVRDMFLDAGAEVEAAFEYDRGHEWVPEEIHPLIAAWVPGRCLADPAGAR